MIFNAIYSPVWADEAHTAINVTIDTDEYGAIPFTATPDDVEDYGAQIYQACIGGVFGEVSDFVAPVVDWVAVNDEKKARLMSSASGIIAPLADAVELGIATKKEMALLKAWRTYRVALNRIDTGANDIEWPEPPTP